MQYACEVFEESDFLSRLLTSNPYTAEGKSILNGLDVKLTTENFFEEKLYAEPFFKNRQNATNTPADDVDEEYTSDKEDYIFVSDDNSNFKNLMLGNYQRFQSSFNNLHELPLLFIRGGSGTGKSTFMYCLIHELTKNNPNIFHTELTLEKYIENLTFYGISLPGTADDTISRFIRIVLAKIFCIVNCEIKDAKDNCSYDRLNNAFDCYNKTFMNCSSENPVNIAVFKALGSSEYENSSAIEHNKEVARECIKLVTSESNKMNLSNLLMLLFELCYCLNSPKFNLISFDGIEYLINRKHHVYDPDINCIIETFEETKLRAITLFEECNLKFADHFKIVLAIRNATLDYSNEREQENIRDSNISVDVTNWYRIKDIYEARIEYFSKNNYINKDIFNKINRIVNTVIKDSKKGKNRASGVMDMLERMYNFDKRSLQSNLLSAVSQIVLSAEGGILKEKFVELYNNVGPMVYMPNKNGHRFRYLCRRAIIRILLNRIEMESRETFFDGIYFSDVGYECMQSSYMRKMLIFLMHNQVIDNKITDKYVSFDSVINAIARPSSNSDILETTLEQIITLIYKLSDYKLHNSAWQQLISVKFKCSDTRFLCDESSFVDKIKELYHSGGLSNDSFGVKLNYAGAFLAYIQSDFEFFACRCKDFKVPLIFTNDVNYIESLLDAVHSKAVDCIKMVIADEKSMFKSYKDMYLPNEKYLYKDTAYNAQGRLISHPKRIINNHIMYLEHYRCFVSEVEGIFPSNDRNKIIEKVDQIISKYRSNYNDLVEGYGSPNGDFDGAMFLKDYSDVAYLWKSIRI